MAAYASEFALALFAVAGTLWVISEFWVRRDWSMVFFFAVFLVAPAWFAVAGYRTIAYGEADWLFNRAISFWVRAPLVAALYVVAFSKRVQRNGHPPGRCR